MPKRKKKTKHTKGILTAAGLFTAGSIVGAAFDFSSISGFVEITAPSLNAVLSASDTPEENEETTQFLSAETENAYTPEKPEETEKADFAETPSVSENTETAVPEPTPAPAPDPVPEPNLVSEPNFISEPVVEPMAEPEPQPEAEPQSDWMEAIFVPASDASSEPPAEDWMITEPDDAAPFQTITPSPETSSMTDELAGMLESIAVFWTPSGEKIHLDPACRAFENGQNIRFAGTLEEAQSVCPDGWCKWCTEHLYGTENSVFYVKGNPYAALEPLTFSYTYDDYLNKIPASAFGD